VSIRAEAAFAGNGEGQSCDDGLLLLDEVCELFAARATIPAMSRLVEGLRRQRNAVALDQWAWFQNNWARHPIATFVHQDPLTHWSYRKPRGYPGDAQLLDFIYKSDNIHSEIDSATECGREIYQYTTQAAPGVAVCERRDILAALVDRIADERGGPIDVLAIASGHLREADGSIAARRGRVARWVALDQDEKSVAYIRENASSSCIFPVHGSVRGILGRRYDLGSFDVIYAAGLYDYLALNVAQRLTEIAFSMLKPGGTYLYTNFVKQFSNCAYMEICMDWHLLCRDMADMEQIWSGIPATKADRRVFFGDNRNIIYATVTKR
jgi:hypothetical protein